MPDKRLIIFGNSGSGKSTFAQESASKYHLAHLDLDTLAWENSSPPTRTPLEKSTQKINLFINKNNNWIIEGCYSDLLAVAITTATEIVFLNPGIKTCISNCKIRPWEPHKYDSAEKQNENLEMLLDWVQQYPIRTDEFSLQSHQTLFDSYRGIKTEYNSNGRD